MVVLWHLSENLPNKPVTASEFGVDYLFVRQVSERVNVPETSGRYFWIPFGAMHLSQKWGISPWSAT